MMGHWGYWGWLALGCVLIGVEILVIPGGFLLWIGLAAVAMAAVGVLVQLSVAAEIGLFAVLSLVCCLIGWKVYQRGGPDAAKGLGERGAAMLGQELELIEGIENGFGRAQFGDSSWRVQGPDLAKGQRVRVTGVDGATLIVNAVT